MASCGFECTVQVVDVVVEYGAEVAGCHRKALVVVWLWLLRRYLDVAWIVFEVRGGVALRVSTGRQCEEIGSP